MFIRKTKTATNRDGTVRGSYRLVESERDGEKVRQRTLLNLGASFGVEKEKWKLLCQRVEELLSAQHHFSFAGPDLELESEARRIAKRLLERQGQAPEEPGEKDFQTVDVNSAEDFDARTAGGEHAALAALAALGLPQLLAELGFNGRQRCWALASIAARMLAPGSERRTCQWLRKASALGEMLDIDFGSLSEMGLYRASDQLLRHQDAIEEHVHGRACELFGLTPTIAFYDLTNTYFEGRMGGMEEAKRGRSKEKRSDCPLLTLALAVDAAGFVMRSRVLAGNIGECRTLGAMLAELGAARGAVVVMDRGIATEDNLKWLRQNGYQHLVVSREKRREFEPGDGAQTLLSAGGAEVRFYREVIELADDDGSTHQEAYLRCYSEARAEKESGIIDRFRKRFEKGLGKINESLKKPKAHSKLAQVEKRVGRLSARNSRVARHYQLSYITDEAGERVREIEWEWQPADGSMATHPGVYCLRSSILAWDAETLWRTYMTLTQVESVFRCLKSELGLRPVFHQKKRRADGHLLISALAYQAVCVLRTRMRDRRGWHDSWTTIRQELAGITRTTTSFQREDGRTLHLRKTARADADQAALYEAMGVAPPPKRLQKTVI